MGITTSSYKLLVTKVLCPLRLCLFFAAPGLFPWGCQGHDVEGPTDRPKQRTPSDLLLVAMPFVPSSIVLFLAGATSSVLAPSCLSVLSANLQRLENGEVR